MYFFDYSSIKKNHGKLNGYALNSMLFTDRTKLVLIMFLNIIHIRSLFNWQKMYILFDLFFAIK